MPGPRAKQNGAKKIKHKAPTQNNATPGSTSSRTLPDSQLHELSNDDWDMVANVLCDHLKLPGMSIVCFFDS